MRFLERTLPESRSNVVLSQLAFISYKSSRFVTGSGAGKVEYPHSELERPTKR